MPAFLKCVYFRHSVIVQAKQYSNKANSNLISLLKSMPKDPKHIAENQKIRKRIKEKSSKYVPGRVTLQVLGTGAEGAPRCLYVFSDQARYLFNCGEGTQRLAHEHKMKLAKLEHIFITQPVWKNIGGLPGTALTIQDVGVPQVTLHGPQGLDELFVATKRFIVIRDLYINMAECNENTEFEDNVMIVQYVPLMRTQYLNEPNDKIEEFENIPDKPSYVSSSYGSSLDTSSLSDDDLLSDMSSLNKIVQAGSSMDTKDATTSTRKKNRSRRNSLSVGPYISEDIVEDDTDYYAHERKKRKRKRRSRSQSVSGGRTAPERISESSKLRLSENKERGVSMAYICRLQSRPGSLNLEKCVQYGVPAGPLLGKLKSGEDIVLDSGVVVKSSDVCEPGDPGPVFIVVDCPTEEYLDSLLSSERFKKYQKNAKDENDLAYFVVHFTSKAVMENPRYQEWIKEFSPETNHVALNDSNTCMGSVAVHRIQYKLNMLSPDFFPVLGDKGTEIIGWQRESEESLPKRRKTDEDLESSETSESLEPLETLETVENNNCKGEAGENMPCKGNVSSPSGSFGVQQANTLCNFHLRPRKGVDKTLEIKLDPAEFIDETTRVEGFRQVLQYLKLCLPEKKKHLSVRQYPKVLFLGTGSCIPNKTRNTSAILLQTSETCNILMDCGEGTYGQIVRFFGYDKVDEVLTKIQAVYISHLHADHHIGLIGFLQGRRQALNRSNISNHPVFLMAPHQILNWLYFYDRCFESINKEYELIPNGDLILNDQKVQQSLYKKVLNTLNMTEINTVLVRHCPNAFGVAFTHTDGYKITYSGDTMPCPNLVKLGMNSDLLIHEATMEDELAGEAVIKMHSTTSQAINVGKEMHAKYTLLTHFSQRYAKLPRFNENFTDNIGIAFDNMQVKLDELPLVPLLFPSLKIMFAEHYEELEHKAIKRQLKKERQREASRERSLNRQLQKT